jgi:RNA polymerase sigma-70 factor (ECF subfamily)
VPDTADAATPEATVLERAGGLEAVRRIRALLPPDQAEVVLLRVVAGLSVGEVAAVLGRKPAAVSVLQHRALRRLADRLAAPQHLTPGPAQASA